MLPITKSFKAGFDYLSFFKYSKTNGSLMSKKSVYLQEFEIEMEKIKERRWQGTKPKLLLHCCCAPCSSSVLETIGDFFDITLYYYNPNIHPTEEYIRRRDELKHFIKDFPQGKHTELIIPPYDPKEYFDIEDIPHHPERKEEPEKGERCSLCYSLRISHAFEYAITHGFEYVTTVLSISPHKDAEKINTIGKELEKKYEEQSIPIHFLVADFKKKNGFKRSLELSQKYALYRQDYCGCVFSQRKSENNLTTDSNL